MDGHHTLSLRCLASIYGHEKYYRWLESYGSLYSRQILYASKLPSERSQMIFRLIPIPWQNIQPYIPLYSPCRCITPNSSICHSTAFLMILDLLPLNYLYLKTISALIILKVDCSEKTNYEFFALLCCILMQCKKNIFIIIYYNN